MKRRTNCNNCGAVLVDGKCQYCGAKWFSPGFELGDHAIVTQAQFEMDCPAIDVGVYGEQYRRYVAGPVNYEVTLTIRGLTGEEMQRLFETIRDGMR